METNTGVAVAPKMDEAALAALRSQIDAVDDQILTLLKTRMGFVKEVGALKHAAAPGQCPIRPGREAEQLRRVTAALAGSDFLPAAGAAMWRMMIMASLALEGEVGISVCAPDAQRDLFWLAREYFGPFSTVMRQPTPMRVLGDLRDGKAQVGVLPLLENGAQGVRWWPELASTPDQPKIFAHLPFLGLSKGGRDMPRAYAIARIAPEPTGDDISVLALQATDAVSQHRFQTVFGQAGLEARWIEIFSPTPGARWHLLEVKGFVTPESPAYRMVAEKLGPDAPRAIFLGAFATPLAD